MQNMLGFNHYGCHPQRKAGDFVQKMLTFSFTARKSLGGVR
jgi:hypothetical protein